MDDTSVWRNVRVRRRKDEPVVIAVAERIADGVTFAEMIWNPPANGQEAEAIALASLQRWEYAPLKPPEQPLEDYLKGEPYRAYAEANR